MFTGITFIHDTASVTGIQIPMLCYKLSNLFTESNIYGHILGNLQLYQFSASVTYDFDLYNYVYCWV